MPQLHYQELNLMQALDVLRQGTVLHLALTDGAMPYVIPLHYQLEVQGMQIILHMVLPPRGRAMDMLRRNVLACAEVDLPACAFVDTVLANGTVQWGAASTAEALDVCLLAEEISARRYFHPAPALAFS